MSSEWISGLPVDEPNALGELLSRGLPKWPGLVVVGKKVTPEQAAEIIVRTDSAVLHGPSGNDRQWVCDVGEAMGLTPDRGTHYWLPDWREVAAAAESVGALDLEYLANDRVSSAYIGGPKGWVGWDGFVGCNTFNVGKWPSCRTIYREWERIAQAFPFLSLRAQLMSGEQCEDDIAPVIEYRVENGTVAARDPEGAVLLDMQSDLTPATLAGIGLMAGPRNPRERGCTIDQFTEAFKAARAKFAGGEA